MHIILRRLLIRLTIVFCICWSIVHLQLFVELLSFLASIKFWWIYLTYFLGFSFRCCSSVSIYVSPSSLFPPLHLAVLPLRLSTSLFSLSSALSTLSVYLIYLSVPFVHRSTSLFSYSNRSSSLYLSSLLFLCLMDLPNLSLIDLSHSSLPLSVLYSPSISLCQNIIPLSHFQHIHLSLSLFRSLSEYYPPHTLSAYSPSLFLSLSHHSIFPTPIPHLSLLSPPLSLNSIFSFYLSQRVFFLSKSASYLSKHIVDRWIYRG